MWNPNSAPQHFNLSIQFNKAVSADGYARVRDAVILTKGVEIVSEDAENRTMNIKFSDDIARTVKEIPGVEATTKIRISGSSNGGGCFDPRR